MRVAESLTDASLAEAFIAFAETGARTALEFSAYVIGENARYSKGTERNDDTENTKKCDQHQTFQTRHLLFGFDQKRIGPHSIKSMGQPVLHSRGKRYVKS